MLSKFDQLWLDVAKNIQARGWHITGVFGSSNVDCFSYSVGAAFDLPGRTVKLPEVIITGLDPRNGGVLINGLLDELAAGSAITETEPYTGIANMPLYLRKLTHAQAKDHMTMAKAFHKSSDFSIYQMVYPDPKGRFPWEQGYDFKPQTLLFNL